MAATAALPLEAWIDERLVDVFNDYENHMPAAGAPLYGALCPHIAREPM